MGTALPQRVTFAVGWKGPDALQAHTHPSHCKYTVDVQSGSKAGTRCLFYLFVCFLFVFIFNRPLGRAQCAHVGLARSLPSTNPCPLRARGFGGG